MQHVGKRWLHGIHPIELPSMKYCVNTEQQTLWNTLLSECDAQLLGKEEQEAIFILIDRASHAL